MAPTRNVSSVNRVKDEFRFLKTWATSPLKMGAVAPTSRTLSRLMVQLAHPDPNGWTLELGPGTGVVTEALIEAGIPQERIVSVEYESNFARLLSERFAQVNVIHGNALDLDSTLGALADRQFSAVLSGVPLLTLPRVKRFAFIESAMDRLTVGGNLTQLSYSLKPPLDAIPGRLTMEKSKWVTFNFPPGRVWIFERPAARVERA